MESQQHGASPGMPDDYDRTLGGLQGLPGMAKTKPTMIRVIPPLGVGGSATYSVTTYRQQGDVIAENDEIVRRSPPTFTVFLEVAKGERLQRIVIPHDVAALIARQRDTLNFQAQKLAAKQGAATRKARGFKPSFTKRSAR